MSQKIVSYIIVFSIGILFGIFISIGISEYHKNKLVSIHTVNTKNNDIKLKINNSEKISKIKLVTNPKGAIITDSTYMFLGTSPMTLEFKQGKYELLIKKAGYQKKRLSLKVLEGKNNSIYVKLIPSN